MLGTAIMRASKYSGRSMEYMLLACIHYTSSKAYFISTSNGNLRFL